MPKAVIEIAVSNLDQFERVVRTLTPGLLELEENDREAAMAALTHIVRVEVGK